MRTNENLTRPTTGIDNRENTKESCRIELTEIPSVDRFPFHIKQTQSDFCIPASIEAVTRYFVPNSTVTQNYLWNTFVAACAKQNMRPQDISFKSIKELVIDNDSNFTWAESRNIGGGELHSFEELSSVVRHSVDEGIPHMISVPVRLPAISRTLWHMLTTIGYDHLNLRVYDPDQSKQSPYDLPLAKLRADLETLAHTSVTDSLVLRPKRNLNHD